MPPARSDSQALSIDCSQASGSRVQRLRHPALLLSGICLTVATVGLYAPFGAYWEWNFTNSPGFLLAAAGVGTSLGRALGSSSAFVAFHITAFACLWWSLRRRREAQQIDAALKGDVDSNV